MKKTQVALAAVALLASTAALADVTISGQFDVGVFNSNKSTGTNAIKGGTFMEQGGLMDHSSITINANEDLGSGLKAFAVLESGFNANGYNDNGGTGNTANGANSALFNRQSFIGLSSDTLGSVGLGKQLSPFILSQALTNFGVGSFWVNRLGVGTGAAAGGVAALGNGQAAAGFFIPNAVTYTSPSIAGFTVRVMTTTPNGTSGNKFLVNNPTAGTASDNRYTSASVSGNVAGAFVSAAYQNDKNGYKSWTLGGTMQVVDGFSVMANYMDDKDDASITGARHVKSWAIGGKYTLVAGTDAILQYAQNDGNGNFDRDLINLTVTHALSKRTTLYATAAQAKNSGAALGTFGNRDSFINGESNKVYGVGVAHSF